MVYYKYKAIANPLPKKNHNEMCYTEYEWVNRWSVVLQLSDLSTYLCPYVSTHVSKPFKWKNQLLYKNYRLNKACKCDRACENRACGLKYTMSFDETYLNTEM